MAYSYVEERKGFEVTALNDGVKIWVLKDILLFIAKGQRFDQNNH